MMRYDDLWGGRSELYLPWPGTEGLDSQLECADSTGGVNMESWF